jgi:hypothetical protein
VSEVPYRIIIVEFLNFILDIEFPPSRHWWTHNCEKLVDVSDPKVSFPQPFFLFLFFVKGGFQLTMGVRCACACACAVCVCSS